jgi:DNA-binding NarL/FixJ family response regulator
VIQPRVLLVDDHRIVAEGLKSLLADDFEVVGIAEDGRAMISATKELKPDVVVADIALPKVNGIDAMTLLRREMPQLRVVFLTMQSGAAYARRAFEAGANGYVLKHSAASELVVAIRAALKGQTYITPALTNDLLGRQKPGNVGRSLTPRQRDILQLFADGRSAKEIAATLGISSRTVEFHKYQIMEQHGLSNTAELIHFAIKHDILTI